MNKANAQTPRRRPIDLTPTKHNYITGYCALNLIDPATGHTADWHSAGWSLPADSKQQDPATRITDMEGALSWIPLWNGRQLFDCRESLRAMGHPQADEPNPIWCASHVRAIIELALCFVEYGAVAQTVTPDDVSRYLSTIPQVMQLHWWIRKIGIHMEGEDRKVWYDWQQKLHPGQHYDTDYPLPWPVFWRREAPPVQRTWRSTTDRT